MLAMTTTEIGYLVQGLFYGLLWVAGMVASVARRRGGDQESVKSFVLRVLSRLTTYFLDAFTNVMVSMVSGYVTDELDRVYVRAFLIALHSSALRWSIDQYEKNLERWSTKKNQYIPLAAPTAQQTIPLMTGGGSTSTAQPPCAVCLLLYTLALVMSSARFMLPRSQPQLVQLQQAILAIQKLKSESSVTGPTTLSGELVQHFQQAAQDLQMTIQDFTSTAATPQMQKGGSILPKVPPIKMQTPIANVHSNIRLESVPSSKFDIHAEDADLKKGAGLPS